jgi:GTP-binding protein Era
VSLPEDFRSGFVALVGRPNAGKSTLVNALVGEKVAIVSDTPQTTRHRLRAILDTGDSQVVFVDTPGLHKPHDALGEELNRSALKALEDVDAALMLVDATKPVGTGDEWVASHVAKANGAKVLVVTKADLASEKAVDKQLAAARGLAEWDDEVVVSAVKDFNLDGLIEVVSAYLPEGPRWFPEGATTDQPLEVLIAEFVREKILRTTWDEVPHAVGVMVDDLEHDERKDLWRIEATVYVERDSQKGIIVGKGGEGIKRVGSEARTDLERLLGGKVYLGLVVKVKSNWRRDASQIRRFGYGEGG